MSTYSNAEYYGRQQDYRGYSQPASKRPPPLDGEEQWYLDGGASNRMALALLSNIPREVEWSLSRLVNLSDEHTNRFVLSAVPKLTEAILYWPEIYLEGYDKGLSVSPYFSPSFHVASVRKHAIESVLTLRNASHNDLNATHLAHDPRMLRVTIAILGLPADEVNTELIVYALELLQAIGPLLPTAKKGKSPYGPVPVLRLEKLLGDSVDRAVIIPALNLLTLLMTTNPAIPPDSPDYYLPPYNPQPNSPALARAIKFIALVQDPALLTASLEFISTYLSNPSASKAFLLNRDLGSTVRLLVGIIRYEQVVETRVIPIGPPIKTATVEDEVPYELTEGDLARLAPIPEPERSFEWMRIMFEYSPGSEQTQVTFWNLYKDTFSPYTDYPMLQAADIIRNVTIQFTEANASVVHGANQRFVIQNIKRRPKAAPPHRFKCNWLTSTCTAAPFSSSGPLYEHVLSHLEADKNPQKCIWGACPYPETSLSILKQHILTHLPPTTPSAKHPSQPQAITLPSDADATYPPATPAARPPPPPPSTTLTHITAASGQTTPTSLLGLYSLRLLFWAAFPSTEAAPVPDENRFGFPSLPLSQHEQKEERGQSEIREAERRGRQAFRNVRNMLLEVHVPDEGIMGWVAEMVSRTYDDEDEDAVAVESSEDTKATESES